MGRERKFIQYSYEEKVEIVSQVDKKKRNRTAIANKYRVCESTIRRWEIDLRTGMLKKDNEIIIKSLKKCNLNTDLMEILKLIANEINKEQKVAKIIPYLRNKGYRLKESLELMGISHYFYYRYNKEVS